MSIPEEEWVKTGGNLNLPYGEGSSSSSNGQTLQFKVYVKGLVEGEARGIGAAICDANDGLLFELSKGLSGKDEQTSTELIDFKALIEGLDAALVLDLKRVIVVTDNPLLYQHGIQLQGRKKGSSHFDYQISKSHQKSQLHCNKMSMEQKRELTYEMSKWPEGASEVLQSWSRQEILQILCAELGKERKYTGLTKSKLIENLLKIVGDKRSKEPGIACERAAKRQRKSDHPTHLLVASNGAATYSFKTTHCKNSACKAKMNGENVFCKRCSCCICHHYDDNKDPSLWLICNSDPPFRGLSCGMSCHLECALRHENSGISQDRQDEGLDGSFCCVSCGKVNDLLSSWRKQLVVARDTRRVDIMCYRLSLSQKILAGTKHYQHLYGIIGEAVTELEEEVGLLTGLPVKKARGIVNRLSSGPKVQRLCASALDSLDSMLSNRISDMPSGCNILDSKLVKFEDFRATSVMVILNFEDSNMGNVDRCTMWHRKADDTDYPLEPTCRLFKPSSKFLLSGLIPSTQYVVKVVSLDTDIEAGFVELRFQTGSSQAERSQSPVINCSSLSVEDENNTSKKETTIISLLDQEYSMPNGENEEPSNRRMVDETSTENGSNTPPLTGLACVPYVDSLPITPCKFENDVGTGKRTRFSGLKKRGGEKCSGGIGDKDFEYYVKVIRWLECEGHLETSFRQKLLTWYSLTASPQEVRIVKVFIDTFEDDPESLAGQLFHSFSDAVSNKRCSRVRAGFCTKLWH